jgi:hypothetical protein
MKISLIKDNEHKVIIAVDEGEEKVCSSDERPFKYEGKRLQR